jgi:hypothetical protein
MYKCSESRRGECKSGLAKCSVSLDNGHGALQVGRSGPGRICVGLLHKFPTVTGQIHLHTVFRILKQKNLRASH